MDEGAKRLRTILETYTEAVQQVRMLDKTFNGGDTEEEWEAKMALMDLDTGLVVPHFHARAILTYTPETAESPAITSLYERLNLIDAIRRADAIVETMHKQGVVAARPAVEMLAAELREWAEVSLATPEVQLALVAYNANPLPMNLQRRKGSALAADHLVDPGRGEG